jgi:two-component system chemotaxis response regulator CheB
MGTIRVLLAEDSTVTREYLIDLIGEEPGMEVVGVARDGVEAVELAERIRPDVILMDVHMPRMDGLEATRRIMATVPTPIVLATGSLDAAETALSFEGIRAGALAVLDKPRGPDDAETLELLRTVRLMSEVKVVMRRPVSENGRSAPPAAGAAPAPDRRVRLVAIGASTGGPAALAEILGALTTNLDAPILVVQHITPGFTTGLVDWLSSQTALRIQLAETGQPLLAGQVYVAPDGRELGVTADGHVRLTQRADGGFAPSASHLFGAVADTYGRNAMGVLLTGMGADGAEGMARLRARGAITVAQSEATSVVFGMPAEAIRRGVVDHVLAPREIARLVEFLAAAPGRR